MADLATQTLAVTTGNPPTFAAAAAGGDKVVPGDNRVFIVKNGGGSSINVTIATPGNLPTGDAKPDKVYAVGAGAERWIPLGGAAGVEFRDPADSNKAAVTYSGVTTVTVAVVAV